MQGDDHGDIVAAVKQNLITRGVDLSGACGAFAITSRVAWVLRGEGAGLLAKPAGNNCQGFAADIVAYPDGTIVDILGDAGGANTPQWGAPSAVDADRYRAAFNPDAVPAPHPGPQPGPQPGPPPPVPPPAGNAYDEAQATEFSRDVFRAYDDAARAIDRGLGVWIARMQFDAVTMGYAASRVKHLAELRAALGLT